jgi:hypothetical protein
MPNGKGAPCCENCRNCLAYPRDSINLSEHGTCKLWSIKLPIGKAFFDNNRNVENLLIPSEEFYTLHLVCKDYEPDKEIDENVVILPKKVKNTLHKGLLYAVSDNLIWDPTMYHKVVCILDTATWKTPQDVMLREYWMDESVERYVGELIKAKPLDMLQALWIHLDSKQIIYANQREIYGKNFCVRINRFWDYLGRRYGGIGRVEDTGHVFQGFWVIFKIMAVDKHNFRDQRHAFDVNLGPNEPILWRDRWPRLETGIPRLSGIAQLTVV